VGRVAPGFEVCADAERGDDAADLIFVKHKQN